MKKSRNKKNNKTVRTILFVVACLLILIAIFFACHCLYHDSFSDKKNSYRIENKYYGFELQTPKDWVAEKKTAYSEENIMQIIGKCKNDNSIDSSVYEIGRFRFKSQRYPAEFMDSGFVSDNFPSGIVFSISVSCIPVGIENKVKNNIFTNFKIDGSKTIKREVELEGLGKTEQISFLHDNLQYKIIKGIYISPNDKEREEQLKKDYTNNLEKIISSFKFVN